MLSLQKNLFNPRDYIDVESFGEACLCLSLAKQHIELEDCLCVRLGVIEDSIYDFLGLPMFFGLSR